MKKKIIILTDSTGLGRNQFSKSQNEYFYEDTFPYLLRSFFKEDIIYQLSYGGISSGELLGQIQSYFINWRPDIIIIHSGLNECKPLIFSKKNIIFLKKFFGRFVSFINKLLMKPIFLKRIGKTLESPENFKKKNIIFKSFFENTKIYTTEIICDPKLENRFYGVSTNIKIYNKILKDIYMDNFINLSEDISPQVFLEDGLHLSKYGHNYIFEKIKKKLTLNK